MDYASIANTTSKWIEVQNTPESGKASGIVYQSLTADEKKIAQNIMNARSTQTDRKDVFFVTDCETSRKLFAGFYAETKATF